MSWGAKEHCITPFSSDFRNFIYVAYFQFIILQQWRSQGGGGDRSSLGHLENAFIFYAFQGNFEICSKFSKVEPLPTQIILTTVVPPCIPFILTFSLRPTNNTYFKNGSKVPQQQTWNFVARAEISIIATWRWKMSILRQDKRGGCVKIPVIKSLSPTKTSQHLFFQSHVSLNYTH